MLIVSSESSIPAGYRFRPTREEILHFYLLPPINGKPVPSSVLIEREIYGENMEPWNLFDKNAEQSFWVFTKLKKRDKSRIDRTAGSGSWFAIAKQIIKDSHGQVLGFDKSFKYKCKKDEPRRGNGHWIMHEFSLLDEGLNDYVVCKIENRDTASIDRQDDVEDPNKKKLKTLELSDPPMKQSNQDQDNADEGNGSSSDSEKKDAVGIDHQDDVEPNKKKRRTLELLVPPIKQSDRDQDNADEGNGSSSESENRDAVGIDHQDDVDPNKKERRTLQLLAPPMKQSNRDQDNADEGNGSSSASEPPTSNDQMDMDHYLKALNVLFKKKRKALDVMVERSR